MDYKITKINTNEKAAGMPIAVSLDEIVERMRSDKDLQAVEELAARVQLLRMDPRPSTYGEVRGASKLPYLIFSALFGRQGKECGREVSRADKGSRRYSTASGLHALRHH